MLEELSLILTSLNLPDTMSIEEFLSIPEEDKVYVVLTMKNLLNYIQSDLPTDSNSKEADDSIVMAS